MIYKRNQEQICIFPGDALCQVVCSFQLTQSQQDIALCQVNR
jgi:hypothetical protein